MEVSQNAPNGMTRDLADLPKAHNHVHLDGAMRRETLLELCSARGIEPPQVSGYGSFAHFADSIAAVQAVLVTEADVRRLVAEIVEDALNDGAVWIELSVWPGALPSVLGDARSRIELVLDAGRTAAEKAGIGFGLMLAANRDYGPVEAIEVARLAESLRNEGVVSLGLDGDEYRYPPELFEEAFRFAKRAGLIATPHAGELQGPSSVGQALEALGADRILHGVRAIEDQSLLVELAMRQVCLDVCPTSNIMLSVYPSLQAHPLTYLLRSGVPCSLNADDPLLFGTSLLREYELAQAVFGLSDAEIAEVARSSVRFSGAPEASKRKADTAIDRWLDQ